MSKYSNEQLQAMAGRCVEARNKNDQRVTELVLCVAVKMNMSPDHVWQKILDMAGGNHDT